MTVYLSFYGLVSLWLHKVMGAIETQYCRTITVVYCWKKRQGVPWKEDTTYQYRIFRYHWLGWEKGSWDHVGTTWRHGSWLPNKSLAGSRVSLFQESYHGECLSMCLGKVVNGYCNTVGPIRERVGLLMAIASERSVLGIIAGGNNSTSSYWRECIIT